jgi:UDP-N-acetylglucosamine 2-epimerase (non-hydrolysing)
MVHVFVGTKAQFIKVAPLMLELGRRSIAYRYIDSGQHGEITASLRGVFGIRAPDVYLRDVRTDIQSIPTALAWYASTIAKAWLCPRDLRTRVFPGGGVCLIHGDTATTLMGMQLARRAGLEVAHVEAGLRSFDTWDPFPEELIRIYCMKRASLLFAPSEEAQRNLEQMGVRGTVFRVSGNTVADALRAVRPPDDVPSPEGPYVLATCHRLETITNGKRLTAVVDLFNTVAREFSVVFVLHKPTANYLDKFGLTKRVAPNVTRLSMQDYASFVALQRGAIAVLTDGGSIQEECAYLNTPCLILRKNTERRDGIGRNATLWRFDDGVARSFIESLTAAPRGDAPPLPHPSAEIVDALVREGLAVPKEEPRP